MYELLVKIKFLLPSLPRAERDFAEALLENPEAITKMTLAAIATESGSSEASVIRFCKRLGFDGYTALKKAFEDSIDENIEPSECVESCDDMKVIAQKVFKSNMQTMQNTMVLVDEEYERAVSALLNARAIQFFCGGGCKCSMPVFHDQIF